MGNNQTKQKYINDIKNNVEYDSYKIFNLDKNFTFNEHFFPSHFPNDPNVPGFIQIETCFQAFLLTFLSIDNNKGKEVKDLIMTKKFLMD